MQERLERFERLPGVAPRAARCARSGRGCTARAPDGSLLARVLAARSSGACWGDDGRCAGSAGATRARRAAAGAHAGRAAGGAARRPRAARGAAGAAASRCGVGVVVPQFRRGWAGTRRSPTSLRGLEARGHACSVWVVDEEGRHAGAVDARRRGSVARRSSGRCAATVRLGLRRLGRRRRRRGHRLADGPRGAAPARRGARAPTSSRTTSPSSTPTSAEREWAAWTYRQGLHCIAASPWLAGARARALRRDASTSFDLGRRPRALPPATRPTAATTSSSSTRARSRRGAPSRSGCSRWRSCTAAAPTSRSRCSARRAELDDAVPPPPPRRARARRAGARLRAAAVGPRAVADQPVAHPARRCSPAGCPCVDLASDSMRRDVRRPTARSTLARVRPAGAVRRDRARCSTTSCCAPSARGRAPRWVAARTWPRGGRQVEAGLRAGVWLGASAG